ncbi:MAG: DUF3391 domain-containing protein [Fidelibacterota bacterium]|nr:MAG: DUF3391 domain-containing protein [Candidatus Neomarinimicrobiota bacterium]
MLKRVKVKDLKVGMYVDLSGSWLRHSFLKQKFKITSQKQIEKIIADGIKEVKVDISKSDVIGESSPTKEVEEGRDQISSPAKPETPASVQKAGETDAAIPEDIDAEEKEPAPDIVAIEEEESVPEVPPGDTVTMDEEDAEGEPSPEIVALDEEESSPEVPPDDTMSIEEEGTERESSLDADTIEEEESDPESPIIDTIKIESEESGPEGPVIDTINIESKETGPEGPVIDTIIIESKETGPEGPVIDTVTIEGKDMEWEPGPDTVTVEEKESGPEGPGIDTVKAKGKDVEWEPGPDTVTVEEKESGPEGPGIDTVKVKGKDVEWEQGPDIVAAKEKESGSEGPGIGTVKVKGKDVEWGPGPDIVAAEENESGPEGPVIDTVKVEGKDVEWKPGPDVVTVKEKESGPDGPVIDTVKIEPGSTESGSGIADVGVESKEPDVVEASPAKDLNPLASLTVDLRKIIKDADASPSVRANAFYSIAKKMMNQTLAHPNADNIIHAKEIVGDIAEVILDDDSTANCFTQIVSHNPTCYIHSVNVGVLGLLLAKAEFNNSPDHDWRELGVGFFLHDLGWCKLPTSLFNKSKRLTKKEWEMIRMHPFHGEKILYDANQLTEECANIILQHHERDDGSGFPFGLSGPRIHVYARICSIADIFDTTISRQARHLHKPKKPTFKALQAMKEEMMGEFSQELFRKFVHLFE